MSQKYRHSNTSVTLINYHFVWIVRRRRKVLNTVIEARLKELIDEVCSRLDCEVIAVEVDQQDHVHLFVNAPPLYSPAQLMHRIKGYTAKILREEFPDLMKLPSGLVVISVERLAISLARLSKSMSKIKSLDKIVPSGHGP